MKKLLILSAVVFLLFFGCRSIVEPEPLPDTAVQTQNNVSQFKSPFVGVIWEPGTTHRIIWNNFNHDRIDILLLKKKQYNRLNIARDVKNNGYYDWTVPEDIQASHHYQIKVVSKANNALYIYSDVFNIYKKN